MQSHVAIATSHAPKDKAWSHRQAFTLSCQGRGKERMLNHLNGSLMLTVDRPQIKHIARLTLSFPILTVGVSIMSMFFSTASLFYSHSMLGLYANIPLCVFGRVYIHGTLQAMCLHELYCRKRQTLAGDSQNLKL